jgi:antitoxin VapB
MGEGAAEALLAHSPAFSRHAILPAMIDLSRETEALAKRLAAARSVSVDDAIRQALQAMASEAGASRERSRDRSPAAVAASVAEVERIVAELSAMPLLDRRDPHVIADDLDALWLKDCFASLAMTAARGAKRA